jgi:hypothetical protein
MIVLTFTIELSSLCHEPVTDHQTQTRRRGRSKRWYGHCRRRTEVPEAGRAAREQAIVLTRCRFTVESSDAVIARLLVLREPITPSRRAIPSSTGRTVARG